MPACKAHQGCEKRFIPCAPTLVQGLYKSRNAMCVSLHEPMKSIFKSALVSPSAKPAHPISQANRPALPMSVATKPSFIQQVAGNPV
jgi:hypothetical protein